MGAHQVTRTRHDDDADAEEGEAYYGDHLDAVHKYRGNHEYTC